MSVLITVNGQARTAPLGITLDQLVAESTELTSGVAAAVGGDVVPRKKWAETAINDGDRIEIVTAVQGG
ncbi:MAG TPA: sulfur carrier protein ThiS [Streptosporangiaceae bacterium]|jgi:sulfur carrier protein